MPSKNKQYTKSGSSTSSEIKELRRKLAILKKKQLAYVNTDLRSFKPTKYSKSLINKIDLTGLFKGEARVQKVSKAEARILKDRERIVKRNRVILSSNISKSERLERVPGTKHRAIHYFGDEGEGYQELVAVENWDEYLATLKDKWANFHANGYQLAFRFYGHLSRDTYTSVDQLINKLNQYSLQPGLRKEIAEDWREVIQHIEIYRTTIPSWEKADTIRKDRAERNRKRKPRSYKSNLSHIMSTEGQAGVDRFRRKQAQQKMKRRKK